jgi:glycosyltransferase involved in cell wall biosynthesis
LKIIILGTRGLPPRYGGRETATDEIGRRLAALGHEVLVYGRSGNSCRHERVHNGIQIVDLPTVATKGMDSLVHVLFSVFDMLRHRQHGVVVLSDVGTSVAMPLLWLSGRRTVWWVDGPAWERSKWGVIGRSYLRAAAWLGIHLAQEVIIDSRSAAEFYRRRFGRRSDYIPYGASVVETHSKETLEKLGLEAGEYLLFVGRLTPEKGVHHLVHAFASLHTKKRLVIVGDNPYDRPYVDSLRSDAGPRVIFAGYQFDEAFAQLMKNCAIYVQPSEVEGTSPVLLTAMGYARPVVVQGIPENLETIGDAGLSFAPGDIEGLAAHLQRLVDHPEEASEWGARAAQRVRAIYDWDDITRSFAEVCARASDAS